MNITPLHRRRGRPRRLKLEDIIEAAAEIGLERFDMASVAQKVGVGITTLYGYVDDRDHLARLIALKIAGDAFLVDRGQSWEDLLRDYADMSFNAYRSCPQLIQQQLTGILGDPTSNPMANSLFALLMDRGLDARTAASLGTQVTQAVLGAGVTAATYDRLVMEAEGESKLSRRLRAACEEHDYMALKQCIAAVGLPQIFQDYRPLVESIIAAHKASSQTSELF